MPTCPRLVNGKWLIVNGHSAPGLPFRSPELSRRAKEGQVLILALFFMGIILILSAALFQKVANYSSLGSQGTLQSQAINLAEAGIDKAVWKLNSGSYTGESNTPLGAGQFTVTVAGDSNTKTITSEGCLPDCTTSKIKRTIQISATSSGSQGGGGFDVVMNQAAQADYGGVTVGTSNSSSADPVIDGDVFSNGEVNGQDFDWWIKGYMKTAYNSYVWFPGICAHVGTPKGTGICQKGLSPSSLPSPSPSANQIRSDANSYPDQRTGISNPQCIPPSSTLTYTLGPTKITGNLSLTCDTIILKGNVYVTGTVDILAGYGSEIRVDDSAPSDVAILADGKIMISATPIKKSVIDGDYAVIWSEKPYTAGNGVEYKNGTSGGAVYAPNGKVRFEGTSNPVAVAAYQIVLEPTARVTYESGIGGGGGGGGGGGSGWQIQKGTYYYK